MFIPSSWQIRYTIMVLGCKILDNFLISLIGSSFVLVIIFISEDCCVCYIGKGPSVWLNELLLIIVPFSLVIRVGLWLILGKFLNLLEPWCVLIRQRV